MTANAIDEHVRKLVRSHRRELIRLVDQALEHELQALVEQRLAARNGGFPTDLVENGGPPVETTRVCQSCGLSRPLGKFEHGRRKVCSTCRSRAHQARIRQAAREPEPEPEPRPASIPLAELAERVRQGGAGHRDIAPQALEAWLLAERLATKVDGGGLVATARAIELGAGLD